ncbi:RIKEN cDNA 4930504E06, isoform CRA_b [Mus musculus]|nr:RIKEN cDNA 4930504E06, isoform CRA_b [Mus musculus]
MGRQGGVWYIAVPPGKCSPAARVCPQIVLLLGEVRRGRRASSSPPTRAEGCGGHPGRSNQQPLSRPAPPGSARPLAFPGSHQRGTRAPSLPAAGGGKRKGLLFFSLPFCGSPGC